MPVKLYSLIMFSHGGGLHNYGLAVDISILDENGKPLPMGTKVDHLGIEAHITNERSLVQRGKITKQERENRLLLRRVMHANLSPRLYRA